MSSRWTMVRVVVVLMAVLLAPMVVRGQSVLPTAPQHPDMPPPGPLFTVTTVEYAAFQYDTSLLVTGGGKSYGELSTGGPIVDGLNPSVIAFSYDAATPQQFRTLSSGASQAPLALDNVDGSFAGSSAINVPAIPTFLQSLSLNHFLRSYFPVYTGRDNGTDVGTATITIATQIPLNGGDGTSISGPSEFYQFPFVGAPTAINGCCSRARGFRGKQMVGDRSTGLTINYDPTDSSPARNSLSSAFVWRDVTDPASAADLAGTPSMAVATDGSKQGGWVGLQDGTGGYHATMWSGSAASAVDLNPAGYFDSRVTGMTSEFQVGDGWFGGPANSNGATRHALLWYGTADSVVDLNQFLPPSILGAEIRSADASGNLVGSMTLAPTCATCGGQQIGILFTPITPTPTLYLASLTVTPSNAAPGDTTTGTVTLRTPAPAGGGLVTFTSDNFAFVPAPANVLIPAGQTIASFSVPTNPNTLTAFVPAPVATTLVASAGLTSLPVTVTVTPGTPVDPIASVTLPTGRIAPGSTVTGLVTLAAPAPDGGVIVSFNTLGQTISPLLVVNPACGCFDQLVTTYYNPNVYPGGPGLILTPASIVVPAGQTSASVSVVTGDVPFTGMVTVVLQAATGNVMKQAPFTIAVPTKLSALEFDGAFNVPTTAPFPGGTSGNAATVRTNVVPETPLTVTFTSTNPAVVMPASVTDWAGGQSFTFSTLPVPVLTTGIVTATANGSSVSAPISVSASPQPAIRGVAIPFVSSGQRFTGTVSLTGAALLGGATISLTSDTPAVAAVPASITIPFGATTATFSGVAGPVAGATTVAVTASFNGAATPATLSVIPGPVLAITSYTLSPYSMIGPGVITNGTITINQPAPAGGVVVALSASSSAAKVPATVTVAAGQTSATFGVPGNGVSAVTTVTLGASYQGPFAPMGPVSASAGLTVAPTDTLKALKGAVTWSTSTHVLTVNATSTNPLAIITALNGNGSVPLGTMTNLGNGNYTFQTTIATISSVNFKSNLGGSTGLGVSVIP